VQIHPPGPLYHDLGVVVRNWDRQRYKAMRGAARRRGQV
jgi:hypothetical protein